MKIALTILCKFFYNFLSYFEQMIVSKRLSVCEVKVDALYKIPTPSNVFELSIFFGLKITIAAISIILS